MNGDRLDGEGFADGFAEDFGSSARRPRRARAIRGALLGAATLLVLLGSGATARAAGSGAVNAGDTAWLLTATALVLLMTAPGLGLFYGGLVGERNALATVMQSVLLLCVVSLQWVVLGYTLSFGSDMLGLVGGPDYLGLAHVGPEAAPGLTVPHVAFAMYQCAFAVITVALITGAFAERIKLSAFLLFSILWTTLVYDPLAHWVWGGGWLMKLGALDFAGGTVVHVSSGVSALVAACVVGRRRGDPARSAAPHSVMLTVIGAAILWFGWFGFNAGSALASGGLAAMAFAVTNVAAASAALAWGAIEWRMRGKATAVGIVSGAVAGLVAITPAAGYVSVPSAIVIGAAASAACYAGVNLLKPRFGYDDTLDVFGIHGIGGCWGALATGLFASKAVNPAGADGLLYGNPSQLLYQAVAVAACAATAAAGTFAVLLVVRAVTPLRVSDDEEQMGLDTVAHGEPAYAFAQGEIPAHVRRGGSPAGESAPIGVMGDEALAKA